MLVSADRAGYLALFSVNRAVYLSLISANRAVHLAFINADRVGLCSEFTLYSLVRGAVGTVQPQYTTCLHVKLSYSTVLARLRHLLEGLKLRILPTHCIIELCVLVR